MYIIIIHKHIINVFRKWVIYEYYKEERIVCDENKCTLSDYIKLKDLKQTKFHEYCPFIVSVLQGKGNTAKEKSDYLWKLNKTELGNSQPNFYANILCNV